MCGKPVQVKKKNRTNLDFGLFGAGVGRMGWNQWTIFFMKKYWNLLFVLPLLSCVVVWRYEEVCQSAQLVLSELFLVLLPVVLGTRKL